MKTLRLFATILVLVALSGGYLSLSAEDDEGWVTQDLKLVLCKNEKETLDMQAASFIKFKIFYEESHWLDSPEDAKYKNYTEEAIGYPTKSTRYRGVYVKRDKTGLEIDTNGDDKTDTRVVKSGSVVKIKVKYPESEDTLALAFFSESKDIGGLQKIHWFYSRAYYWTGKIGSTPVNFFDDNVDGFLNVIGSDGIVFGEDGIGSYLSTISLVNGKLYEIKVDELGKNFSYRPFLGKSVKVDFASKYKGPVKPEFVVLRTPFERERPDPRSISIYLAKCKGIVPEASYEVKFSRINERCLIAPHPREGQWVDDLVLPYIPKGKDEKFVFPFKPPKVEAINKESLTIEWGAPFGVHTKPYHEDEDGGAKVDNLCVNVADFMFYDSFGLCYYAPIEFETGNAALPEDMMFEIIAYNPKTGEQISRNTRYTPGEGGGWGPFKIPIGGLRGTFKVEIKIKTKVFGLIDSFVDFKLENPEEKK